MKDKMRFNINTFNICSLIASVLISLVVGLNIDTSWTYKANFILSMIILISIFFGVTVILHLFIFNLGNFIRALYYKIIGYSLFPLVLFPFCINYHNNSLKVTFTIRTSVAFYDFLPNGIESKNNDIEYQLKIIKKGLYIKKYSRTIFLLLSAIICVMCKAPIFILIVLAMLVEIYIFENINERRYHGERIKIQNINAGNGIIYLLGITDICDNLDEKDTNKIINMFSQKENKNYILSGVKRSLVNVVINHEKILNCFDEKILELLLENPKEVSINPDTKELDITFLFMYFALITENVVETNKVLQVIKQLQLRWGSILKSWFNYFQWYIEIIRISRGEITDFTVKEALSGLIKTDSIGAMPGEYYDRLRQTKSIIDKYLGK